MPFLNPIAPAGLESGLNCWFPLALGSLQSSVWLGSQENGLKITHGFPLCFHGFYNGPSLPEQLSFSQSMDFGLKPWFVAVAEHALTHSSITLLE